MNKGFKITLIVICLISGAIVLLMVIINLIFYFNTQTNLKNSPAIVKYMEDDYGDDLKIVYAEQEDGREYYEITVSSDFKNKNEEISTKLYDISNKFYSIRSTTDGVLCIDSLHLRFNLSDDKYIVFGYQTDMDYISLNFAITQKELDKLSENNTEVHGYSLK